MNNFKPKKPSHNLGLMDPETGARGVIGAAWEDSHGGFTIKLNPGVTLTYETLVHMKLRLFSRDRDIESVTVTSEPPQSGPLSEGG